MLKSKKDTGYYTIYTDPSCKTVTFYTGSFGNCQSMTANNFQDFVSKSYAKDIPNVEKHDILYKDMHYLFTALYEETRRRLMIVDVHDWVCKKIINGIISNNSINALLAETKYPDANGDEFMKLMVIDISLLKKPKISLNDIK